MLGVEFKAGDIVDVRGETFNLPAFMVRGRGRIIDKYSDDKDIYRVAPIDKWSVPRKYNLYEKTGLLFERCSLHWFQWLRV